MKTQSRLLITLMAILALPAHALTNRDALITDKHISQFVCLDGVLQEGKGAPVTVVAVLAEIIGPQLRIMVNELRSEQPLPKGGVAIGETLFRKGQIMLVPRTGWRPCKLTNTP